MKYTYSIRKLNFNTLEDTTRYFMEHLYHDHKYAFEVIETNDYKINRFYLGEFIKQSAFINSKNRRSFNRMKKWLIQNHPDLLI